MREEELLLNRLKRYSQSPAYPFHMPGHKRLKLQEENHDISRKFSFPNPFEMDITEIDGFDNLHHAEGILKDSMEWAARVYGADKTFYLVNGSSCGLLSAISGCVKNGGSILVSRNCHKAVYHGIELRQLNAEYLYPQEIPGLGIQGGILPEDVEKALDARHDIQAVLITSPTYDGMVSDIETIARIVHQRGIPLIVDEAHGAHFRYGKEFPVSALELGADVVIQSVHKTLPSLTQTALLHIKKNSPDGDYYFDPEKLEHFLQIYQSSSPSYVFMASIENSIFQMESLKEEERQFEFYFKQLSEVRARLKTMSHLQLVDENVVHKAGVFALDISKILISVRGTCLKSEELADILRNKYGLEMEMCGADYVTAISTVFDTREGLLRLERALLEIDGELENAAEGESCQAETLSVYNIKNEAVLPIWKAAESSKKCIRLEESVGYISGEFVYLYPPGIPVLTPGERMTEALLQRILTFIHEGLPVQGMKDQELRTIEVIEEQQE